MDLEGRHPVVKDIVDKIKSEGIFDELRKECLADVDTKPAYQNLKTKVENACSRFLSRISWAPSINKIQLRDQMRKSLEDSGLLLSGVKRIVNQVVRPRIDKQVKPKVAQVVCEHLGLRPDDILGIEREEDFTVDEDINQYPPPVSLYPFNPYHMPMMPSNDPTSAVPPPLPPGFDDRTYPPPLPATPPLPPISEEDQDNPTTSIDSQAKQIPEPPGTTASNVQSELVAAPDEDDMEISERSSSGTSSRVSSKNGVDGDMDETETAADLSKGLAAYMAAGSSNATMRSENDTDDMSISSGGSSKNPTPEPPLDETASTGSQKTPSSEGGGAKDASLTVAKAAEKVQPARRQMRRQRTRNKKYMSDDFLSIFTEQTDLYSRIYGDNGDGDGSGDVVIEEEVVADTEYTSEERIGSASGDMSASACLLQPVVQLEASLLDSKEQQNAQPEASNRPDSVASSHSSGSSGKRSARKRSSESTQPRRRSLRQQQQRGFTDITIEQSPSAVDVNTSPINSTIDTPTTSADTAVTSATMLHTRTDSVHDMPHMTVLRSGKTVCSYPASVVDPSSQTEQYEEMDLCESDSTPPDSTRNTPIQQDSVVSITDVDDAATVNQTQSDTAAETSSTIEVVNQDMQSIPLPPSPSVQNTASSELSLTTITLAVTAEDSVTHAPVDIVATSAAGEPDIPTGEGICETAEIVHSPATPVQDETPDTCPFDSRPIIIPVGKQPDDETEKLNAQSLTAEAEQKQCGESAHLQIDGDKGVVGQASGFGEAGESGDGELSTAEEGEVEDEDDLKELERLAQKKLEILKAIEMPDSVLDRGASAQVQSSEEEGEITDSSSEEERRRRKKSKKSKKKKSKSRKHKRRVHSPSYRTPSPQRGSPQYLSHASNSKRRRLY